jgi:hypothetical protein
MSKHDRDPDTDAVLAAAARAICDLAELAYQLGQGLIERRSFAAPRA